MISQKKIIQEKFIKEMGLRVDFPKHGLGSTNDRNSARRFFENPSKTSQITGINEVLIERLSIVLKAMSSGRQLKDVEYKEHCTETARLFVNLYGWYHMSPSVHKILIHSPSVSRNGCL